MFGGGWLAELQFARGGTWGVLVMFGERRKLDPIL